MLRKLMGKKVMEEKVISGEELYTYEQACQIMDEKGLGDNKSKDSITCKFRQFYMKSSSLHIKTTRAKEFRLYATDRDFVNLKKELKAESYDVEYINSTNKEEIAKQVSRIKAENLETIVIVENGNTNGNPNSAEKYIPHAVYFFTNKSFLKVIDILAMNEMNLIMQ